MVWQHRSAALPTGHQHHDGSEIRRRPDTDWKPVPARLSVQNLRRGTQDCYKERGEWRRSPKMTQLSFNHAAVSGETRMTMTLKTLASLATATFLLAGCTSMNVFKDDNTPPPLANDLPPEEPVIVAPPAGKPGEMKAAQINKILSGKSWKWTAPKFHWRSRSRVPG